jgi:hypothetical protein
MDRSVVPVGRVDVPPDLWRSGVVTLTLVAFIWTGGLELVIGADVDALRPRRVAIVLWIGAALWIFGAWRQIRTKR